MTFPRSWTGPVGAAPEARDRPPLVIFSLVHHGGVPLALRCLGSLVRCYTDPHELRILDDGSLTGEDEAVLRSELGATVIRRRDADGLAADRLSRHPRCLAFRTEHVF